MDPFAKKMLQASGALGAVMLLMFAVLTVVYLHVRPPCLDQVVASEQSPGKRWIAAAMERRCGSESPFLTHVNLRPVDQPIRLGYLTGKAEEGEIFLIEQDAESAHVTIDWSSDRQLTVRCAGCSSAVQLKRDQRWNDIDIRYELR